MLKIIFFKELKESLQNYKYLVSLILSIVVLPFIMVLSLNYYKKDFNDYKESMRLYGQQKQQTQIKGETTFKGYKPPSPFSIFANGIEKQLPLNMATSPDGKYSFETEWEVSKLSSFLWGKFDFILFITFVYTLFAFIFTFDIISGEKERGTLKLLFSNSIARWKVILGKLLSSYLLIIIPISIGYIITILLIQNIQPEIIESDRLTSIFLIYLITLLFLFLIQNIGIFVSTLFSYSSRTIISLLALWVMLVVFIPMISPMLAKTIKPVESLAKINKEKELLINDLQKELESKKQPILERYLANNNLSLNDIFMYTPDWLKVKDKFDSEIAPIVSEHNSEVERIIAKIDDDYFQRLNTQLKLAANISKISPISIYSDIVFDLCHTGYQELQNFRDNSMRFQTIAEIEIYSLFDYSSYSALGSSWSMVEPKRETDPQTLKYPEFVYTFEPINHILNRNIINIGILTVLSIVLGTLSFYKFLNYDIR